MKRITDCFSNRVFGELLLIGALCGVLMALVGLIAKGGSQ